MSHFASTDAPYVLAITGASGAIYAVRLIHALVRARVPLHLVISTSGLEVMKQELPELGLDLLPCDEHTKRLEAILAFHWNASKRWDSLSEDDIRFGMEQISQYSNSSYLVPIASGSFLTRGMVICPCSGSTLSGLVHAASNNLIVRAADVHLKEGRKLILVNRETPLSVFQVENMQRAAAAGAIILPAMPGWYHGVTDLIDLVDFIVARIMDQLQIPHQLIRRWGDSSSSATDSVSLPKEKT